MPIRFGGGAALGIGVVLCGPTRRTCCWPLGAATISAANLSTSEQYLALWMFVAVASLLAILVPIVIYFVLGKHLFCEAVHVECLVRP